MKALIWESRDFLWVGSNTSYSSTGVGIQSADREVAHLDTRARWWVRAVWRSALELMWGGFDVVLFLRRRCFLGGADDLGCGYGDGWWSVIVVDGCTLYCFSPGSHLRPHVLVLKRPSIIKPMNRPPRGFCDAALGFYFVRGRTLGRSI